MNATIFLDRGGVLIEEVHLLARITFACCSQGDTLNLLASFAVADHLSNIVAGLEQDAGP